MGLKLSPGCAVFFHSCDYSSNLNLANAYIFFLIGLLWVSGSFSLLLGCFCWNFFVHVGNFVWFARVLFFPRNQAILLASPQYSWTGFFFSLKLLFCLCYFYEILIKLNSLSLYLMFYFEEDELQLIFPWRLSLVDLFFCQNIDFSEHICLRFDCFLNKFSMLLWVLSMIWSSLLKDEYKLIS